jgi:hypothetical protein
VRLLARPSYGLPLSCVHSMAMGSVRESGTPSRDQVACATSPLASLRNVMPFFSERQAHKAEGLTSPSPRHMYGHPPSCRGLGYRAKWAPPAHHDMAFPGVERGAGARASTFIGVACPSLASTPWLWVRCRGVACHHGTR